MSVFNIIGFLLIAGITISIVASADTDESKKNKCDKSHETKKDAKGCIDEVIKKIGDQTLGEWNATVYCGSKSNLTECLTDCSNDKEKFNEEIESIAGKIIDHTCEFSKSPDANETDIKFMQKSLVLLLAKYVNSTQCLNVDKVKSDVKAELKDVSHVDVHTDALSKIIIDSQLACKKNTSGKAGENEEKKNNHAVTETKVSDITTTKPQERADTNQTDTSKDDDHKSKKNSANGINTAFLITVIATCVRGYF